VNIFLCIAVEKKSVGICYYSAIYYDVLCSGKCRKNWSALCFIVI